MLIKMKTAYSSIIELIACLGKAIGHRQCFLCHQSSLSLLCNNCLQDTILPLFPAPGHNLLEYHDVYTHLLEPNYASLYALGRYKGILSGLINKLKFSANPLAAEVLATFFYQYLHSRLELSQALPDVLIPVPLSNLRYIKREFNQARVLSQHLAAYFDIPVLDALIRTKHTKQQSRLSRNERLINIDSAFSLAMPLSTESVAVIDDVITTGATINEACKVIQEAYPDIHISVWCMAVAMRE